MALSGVTMALSGVTMALSGVAMPLRGVATALRACENRTTGDAGGINSTAETRRHSREHGFRFLSRASASLWLTSFHQPSSLTTVVATDTLARRAAVKL